MTLIDYFVLIFQASNSTVKRFAKNPKSNKPKPLRILALTEKEKKVKLKLPSQV